MNFHPGFFLLGAAVFAGAILIFIGEIKKRKRSTNAAKAELVRYFVQVDTDSDSGSERTTYHPIVRYCISGQWYETRNDTCWNKEKYPVGTLLDILYDPEHPEKFRFPGDHTAMVASVFGILLGIGVMVLAFVLQ